MTYTIEQYQRVLAKAAEMRNAIEALQELHVDVNPSYTATYWTEFGKRMSTLFQAKDEYTNEQHRCVQETHSEK